MTQLAILKFGNGSFEQGFPVVILQMGTDSQPHQRQIRGSLPSASDLAELHRDWKLLYVALYSRLREGLRISFPDSQPQPTNVSEAGFYDLCCQLRVRFNQWLCCEAFRPIERELRTYLSPHQEVQVLIETDHLQLRQFPWHLWDFFQDFRQAELALSNPRFEAVQPSSFNGERLVSSINSEQRLSGVEGSRTVNLTQPVRVLAILGNSCGLDLQQEQTFLEQLPQTQLTFLPQPSRSQIYDQLWQNNWEIFFFAGHSNSVNQGETGVLQINPTDSLTISDLENALRHAIKEGLQLAIFNSCDGLGIVRELEKLNLHIPQVVVMREPVPDRVAQAFLTYFLEAYHRGQSLYLAVREARERLQGLENLSAQLNLTGMSHRSSDDFIPVGGYSVEQFPCASWLPTICQNPAVQPPTWDQLRHLQPLRKSSPSLPLSKIPKWKMVLFGSFIATSLVMGVRSLGILQMWELKAYNQFMRLRPIEEPDPRLLVVEATEADINRYRFPLSDQTLAEVIQTLKGDQPRVIGVDIFRDRPIAPGHQQLTEIFQQNQDLIALCSVRSDQDFDKPGVPPPPQFPQDRLGASDVVYDPDGIIRRHVMFLQPDYTDPCATDHTLSSRVALFYLAQQGIEPQTLSQGRVKIGKVVFTPLRTHSGSYHQLDARGMQILLNYRQDVARRVSVTEVLQGKINPNWVKDKIILIGVSAPISSDFVATPYSISQLPRHRMPGVILQAQMVSQIVSAVLDQRPLLRGLSQAEEMLWVWFASVGGSLFVVYVGIGWKGALAVGNSLGFLFGMSWGLFTVFAIWTPFIPSILAFGTSIGCIFLLRFYVRLE